MLNKIKKVIGGNKMENEIEVKDENFQEKVIEQSKKIPVVVDFWARWCGPCRMLDPVLNKLAEEYKGKFILAKIDIEEGKETSSKYGVMSIPNVKIFKDGKVVDEFAGALPESGVREWLDKNLG